MRPTLKEASKALDSGVDENPAIRALDTAYGELQSKAAKLRSAAENSVGKAINETLGIGGSRVATPQQIELESQMNRILETRSRLVEDLNRAKAGSAQVEQDQIARRKEAAANGGTVGDGFNPGYLFAYQSAETVYEALDKERQKYQETQIKEIESHRAIVSSLVPTIKKTDDYTGAMVELNAALVMGEITQAQFSEGSAVAVEKYTNAGKAVAALKKEVDRLNQRENPDDNLAHLNVLRGMGLSDEAYAKEMFKNQQLRMEFMRLKAEGGNTWAILGYAMTQASSSSTDSLVRWMDNLDGVGRSWHTLGSTVRSVIADMLIQMQRAVIQQKLMNPLMQWAGLAISGLTGGGAGPDMTNQMGNGSYIGYNGLPAYANGTDFVPETGLALIHQGERIIPAAQNRAGVSGMQITNQISVTVTDSGVQSQAKSSGQRGDDISKSLEGVLTAWAIKEKRVGGVLEGVA